MTYKANRLNTYNISKYAIWDTACNINATTSINPNVNCTHSRRFGGCFQPLQLRLFSKCITQTFLLQTALFSICLAFRFKLARLASPPYRSLEMFRRIWPHMDICFAQHYLVIRPSRILGAAGCGRSLRWEYVGEAATLTRIVRCPQSHRKLQAYYIIDGNMCRYINM